MDELEVGGVKGRSPEGSEGLDGLRRPRLAWAPSSVERIADDCVSDTRQVDSNLVRATCVDPNAEQSGSVEGLEHPPVGASGAASGCADGHALAVHGMASDGLVDATLAETGDSEDDREVLLSHLTAGELSDEGAVGGVVLGYDEEPRGSLVESMDDPGSKHSADTGEVGNVGEQCVDEGSRGHARSGVHDETGGLLEHEQVRVLVDDVERDGLSSRLRRHRGGNSDADGLPAANSHRRALDAAIDEQESLVDQSLDAGARELGKCSSDPGVEALASVRRLRNQRMRRLATRRATAGVAQVSLRPNLRLRLVRPVAARFGSSGCEGDTA